MKFLARKCVFGFLGGGGVGVCVFHVLTAVPKLGGL